MDQDAVADLVERELATVETATFAEGAQVAASPRRRRRHDAARERGARKCGVALKRKGEHFEVPSVTGEVLRAGRMNAHRERHDDEASQ